MLSGRYLAPLALLLLAIPARAQTPNAANVVSACGTPNSTYTAGQNAPLTQNTSGVLCAPGSGSGTPTSTKPASLTEVTLDIKTVTTGGTAVNALSATHASAGGYVTTANSAGICVNVLGAAGTATSGDTTCVAQNQVYSIPPTANAVSVNSTASSVTLAGYGFQ